MSAETEVHWKDEPDEGDVAAANGYLSLILAPKVAEVIVSKFGDAKVTRHKAKDILRASAIETLGESNVRVQKDLAKVEAGEELSPVLLVAFADVGVPLVIADGYHRVCAVYLLNEDAEVPAKLIHIP